MEQIYDVVGSGALQTVMTVMPCAINFSMTLQTEVLSTELSGSSHTSNYFQVFNNNFNISSCLYF